MNTILPPTTPSHCCINPSDVIAAYQVNCPNRGEVFFAKYTAANALALALKVPVTFIYADGSTFEQI